MLSDAESDRALVRAFQAGDARSFDGLFQRYQRPIFNYVYRMIGRIAPSEDLTQDVFLRVFASLGRSGEIASFRPWLYRIATNAAVSYLRQAERRATSLENSLERRALDEPAGDVADQPEERHLRGETVRAVAAALLRLPEAQRQALVLRQLQGLSYEDIAEVMGLSVEAVTSLLHRARREFRVQFEMISAGQPAGSTKEDKAT